MKFSALDFNRMLDPEIRADIIAGVYDKKFPRLVQMFRERQALEAWADVPWESGEVLEAVKRAEYTEEKPPINGNRHPGALGNDLQTGRGRPE